MLPDLVSSPGPLTCESGALPIALRGPARERERERERDSEHLRYFHPSSLLLDSLQLTGGGLCFQTRNVNSDNFGIIFLFASLKTYIVIPY